MNQGNDQTIDSQVSESKILLIDDSRLMRIAGEKLLGKSFNVIVAENGEEGWEKIQQDTQIHVVFSDLNMPGMSGYELLKRIRSSEDEGIRNLPVIVVTGAEDDENEDDSKRKSLELGATDFITKPFNAQDLRARATAYADYQRKTSVLTKASTIDTLTGLGNRKAFEDQLLKDIAFASRHHEELAVMKVSFDRFEGLVSHIGKMAADALVREISKVLVKTFRDEDTITYFGEATFFVSLPMAKPDGALLLARRICRIVEGLSIRLRGDIVKISVSACVCSVDKGFKPKVDEVVGAINETAAGAQAAQSQVMSCHLGLDDGMGDVRYVSIDRLLTQLASGEVTEVTPLLDDAVDQLIPLITLMSEQQLRQLLGRHAMLEDAIAH